MESISPNGEYLRVEADILRKSAEALRYVASMDENPLSEHVRRAISIYKIATDAYLDGGRLAVVFDEGRADIPLFKIHEDEEADLQRVKLSVNASKEMAEALNEFGVNDEGSETAVLDNVINAYVITVMSVKDGRKIIRVHRDGREDEIIFAA